MAGFLRVNLSKWIPSLKGCNIEIDRAHRMYDGRKNSDRPRTLIFRVLRWHDHIATTARSCRFALYNIRKIRPFLSEQAAQLLVQALVLSRLDYCNALLAGLPACTIKPLQLIQNAAARVVFNEPKKAHVTPLFIRLHWLPIAARIQFKVLMFAYKTTTGTAPIYLNLLVQTYAPSRSLRSASERRLVVPSQRGTKSLSRTFSWTVPSWWNDLPISIRTAESLAIFKKHLKDTSFSPEPD